MHNENTLLMAKKIGYVCDEFLKLYSEDATARVSREAFERSVGDICTMMIKMHAECDERHVAMGLPHHNHAPVQPIYAELGKSFFTCVMLNFHTKELLGQKIERADALAQMKGLPIDLDDEGKKAFIQSFLLQPPRKMTLSEVESMGVKPYTLINHLKHSADTILFTHEVENTATQPSGMA